MALAHAENKYNKYGQPSLDLVFTGPKKSLKNRVGNQQVEFTRSSVGTYVGSDGLIKTAVDDEPRFDYDPVTGESLGLLIEESNYNALQRSTEPDNGYYDLSTGLTKIANNAVSPDGNQTALLLTEDSSTGLHTWGKSTNVSLSNNVMSLFVKSNGATKVGFRQGGESSPNVSFDLSTGTKVSGNGGIEAYPNGWYRIWQIRSGNGNKVWFHLLGDSYELSFQGDGTSGVWVWGFQKEPNKGRPTSLIVTEASIVTRAADIAQITGTNFSSWYNQNQGTVLSTFKSPVPEANTRYWLLITNGANSTADGYRFEMQRILAVTSSGSNAWSSTADWLTTGYTQNAENRTAFGYDRINNSNSFSNNGVIQETNTSATDVTVAPTTITIGAATAFNDFGGHISRLTYYPRLLTDEQLQELTQ